MDHAPQRLPAGKQQWLPRANPAQGTAKLQRLFRKKCQFREAKYGIKDGGTSLVGVSAATGSAKVCWRDVHTGAAAQGSGRATAVAKRTVPLWVCHALAWACVIPALNIPRHSILSTCDSSVLIAECKASSNMVCSQATLILWLEGQLYLCASFIHIGRTGAFAPVSHWKFQPLAA